MVKSITTDATDTKHKAANLRFSMLTAQITARMPQASVNLKIIKYWNQILTKYQTSTE